MTTPYTFGEALLTILEFALLVFWIWIGIRVVVDVFRSRDLSGWAKAGWILLIVLVPPLGVVVYLIVRGDRLTAHEVGDELQQDMAPPPQGRRGAASSGDHLSALEALKDRGILSDEEFQRAKAKARAPRSHAAWPWLPRVAALLLKIALTGGLVSVILGTASQAQNVGSVGALGVGGYVALAGLWSAPVSG